MLHKEIEHDEIVERYVRGQLTPENRHAFEEHYFACDECFEKVQATERFIAGVRDLARRGALDDSAEARERAGWLLWAFAWTSLATIALAALTGWAFFHRIPVLQRDLRAAIVQQPLQPAARTQSAELAEANVPLVMLQATRGEEETTAVLAPGARQLILWVEIGPTRFHSYRMEIDADSGRHVITVDDLNQGPYGALAAGIPAEALQPGIFRVKLIGQTPPPASLVSEYRLQIRRP
jgi:hypothetical protein